MKINIWKQKYSKNITLSRQSKVGGWDTCPENGDGGCILTWVTRECFIALNFVITEIHITMQNKYHRLNHRSKDLHRDLTYHQIYYLLNVLIHIIKFLPVDHLVVGTSLPLKKAYSIFGQLRFFFKSLCWTVDGHLKYFNITFLTK